MFLAEAWKLLRSGEKYAPLLYLDNGLRPGALLE
jgi:hypothetical protein